MHLLSWGSAPWMGLDLDARCAAMLRTPMAPPALERLVKVCLAKDPDDRLQTAHDVMQELKWVAEGSQAGVPAALTASRKSRERLAWSAFTVAALAALFGGLLLTPQSRESPRMFQSSILPPPRPGRGPPESVARAPAAPIRDGNVMGKRSSTSASTRDSWQ